MSSWFARDALLPGGPARDVRFEIEDGRFTAVASNAPADGATSLPGVVLPGFANAHSHAFHRALRGRTHNDGGTFWTWREHMYAVAGRLDPDTYRELATVVYAEMALAGITSVGEFHYLHHGPDGTPYGDPNAMAEALRAAAADAGIRLTLLDTCYLAGGLGPGGHLPLDAVQRRFADVDVERWAERVAQLEPDDTTRIGVAVHSVRAVPRGDLATVVATAQGRPLHVHLSEQPAENEACGAHYGCTPTALLRDAGVLGPATTAVHATHLTADDIQALGTTRTTACFCPTTERDLADGIGPARALTDSGVPLSLGSDQHAVIDPFEEARGLEMHERLRSNERGRFTAPQLLAALTRHDSLGWDGAGRLEVGARADLVTVRTDTVRTAGARPDQILYAATAADVDTVLVDGREVVRGGQHRLGDIGRRLTTALEGL
ncbi:MAG TPA: formimidoylglutamate deiminase [Jatrophihabitans sp.]|jgi:formiminoglutamate deiminase|uniref:formimidoylglutamate deiminase n=1 Tax=Jatrophihabitans sp. TaxID=1932789 RepID=UPI002DFAF679|nr:formimidoylglutamate deiminase [Jatrophihabitans sp.]